MQCLLPCLGGYQKAMILNWDAVLTLEPPRGSGVDGPFSLRCYAYRWRVANGTSQPYTD